MADKREVNANAFRTDAAVENYSSYHLLPAEKYLFEKYYKNGDRILDLACGIARTTLRLYELGHIVKGIDSSDVFIKIARKRFPYLDLEVGSYTDICAPDNSFDHVLISCNGLDCAYPETERIRALGECARVLKRGGTLIFSSHNIKSLYWSPNYMHRPGRLAWWIKNAFRAIKQKDYLRDLRMYLFYASPHYITAQVEREGFRLIDTIGVRMSRSYAFNTYISPWIHYVFRRVLLPGREARE